ncbi:Fe-S cluster domain protein [Olavius sp. associated proteobacterium Delta 1]|nr:Fe-S cluster domain protein [Olavius sp. associated proteobacterium Delta 1]
MLLKSYSKKIFRPECNPGFESVHCIAHLDQYISEVLPYLNAVLGGFDYLKDPPAVIFRSQGKLITVHGDKIAINALRDEAEADKILEWLKREVNDAWANRESIVPCYDGAPKPKVIEILKLLPRTNCRECGEPTCMVFAARMAEGLKGLKDCPPLGAENKLRLEEYMSQFKFEL